MGKEIWILKTRLGVGGVYLASARKRGGKATSDLPEHVREYCRISGDWTRSKMGIDRDEWRALSADGRDILKVTRPGSLLAYVTCVIDRPRTKKTEAVAVSPTKGDDVKWVRLTKGTDDPKLAYIEGMLTEQYIPHRRTGWSFHAPIMEVPEGFYDQAYGLLLDAWDDDPQAGKTGCLDEADDDDPVFVEAFDRGEAMPHDFDGRDRTRPAVGD